MKWFSDVNDLRSKRNVPGDHEAGISLFEMLVAVAIFALLATFVGPRVIGYLGRSQADVAEAQMASIATALELFYLDMGRYPELDEGLEVLVVQPAEETQWRGPYFSEVSGLTDPWGRPYLYSYEEPTGRFLIQSLGRDGEIGGEGENEDLSRS